MPKTVIPAQIKQQVEAIVNNFNQQTFIDGQNYYLTRYRGSSLYLDRYDYGSVTHICRLTYIDSLTHWNFAIFKYSTETYDANDGFFPGAEFIDGTIEGAMKAGLHAYP